MGLRLPQELLQELHTYLRHFDQTGHLGESSTVAEIKRRLAARIVEVEAQIRTMQPIGPNTPEQHLNGKQTDYLGSRGGTHTAHGNGSGA